VEPPRSGVRREGLESARRARCGASRPRSPRRSDSGRPALAARTIQNAPKQPSRPLLVGHVGKCPQLSYDACGIRARPRCFRKLPDAKTDGPSAQLAPARSCKRSEIPDSCDLLTSLQTVTADKL